MLLKSVTDLRDYARRHPWLEAGRTPPVIQETRGPYVETIGLSLNH